MTYKKVYLKPGKEESLKRFHPWVFSGAISRMEGEPEEGEIVDVYTSKKEFIACGHFQIGSIAVRVLSFTQGEINHEFWKKKLEVAYDLRRSLYLAGNPAIFLVCIRHSSCVINIVGSSTTAQSESNNSLTI